VDDASVQQIMQMHCIWEAVECCSRSPQIPVTGLFVPWLLCIKLFLEPSWSHLEKQMPQTPSVGLSTSQWETKTLDNSW